MRAIFIFFLACVLFAACTDATRHSQHGQMDALERVFEAGNWRYVRGVDTSYLFFSREGDTYKVYEYSLKNGDSAGTRLWTIQAHNSNVKWNWMNIQLILEEANDKGSTWQMGDIKYRFKKQDSLQVLLQAGTNEVDTLLRTLPIGAFLVRAKYDHRHGTRTVDSL